MPFNFWLPATSLYQTCFSLICPEMPCFARVIGYFVICSEMTKCGKSEQNIASCYYLLVVKLVVKRKGLLLRILLLTRQILNQRLYGLINMGHNAAIRIYSHQIIINLLLGSSRKDCIYNIFFAFSVNLFLKVSTKERPYLRLPL